MSVDIKRSLLWNPFEGDFGGAYDSVLSDKIVKSKKVYTCCWCGGESLVGESTRHRVEVFERELQSYRYCNTCVLLMAKAVDYDDLEGYELAENELENRRKK